VLPPGYTPVVPTSPAGGVAPTGSVPPAYVPPPGGVLPPGFGTPPLTAEPRPYIAPPPPANLEIASALGPNHPWAVKPEDGAYFICVKSYSRPSRPTPEDSGPSARAMAEALATEIRDLYRVQAFLYEHISDERKAEAAAIAAARERARMFAQQLEKYKQQAQLQGMEWLEDRSVRIHYKTVNYKDEIAVLVGGFKTEKDAREALDKVRSWPGPKTRVGGMSLMDWGTMARPGPDGKPMVGRDGKPMLERDYINPYRTATVVPNPAIPHTAQASATFDAFLVTLNEGRPYNLLTASKGWTLGVKSFTAPVEIVGREGENNSMVRKIGFSKEKDVLAAGAEQAESMAKALRAMKGPGGNPLGLEAFVLHTRHASLVTVGQFDGPNDPALIQTRQLLASMKLNVTEDKMGVKPAMNAPSLFETLMPIRIPRP
jgi:hypothetical protein